MTCPSCFLPSVILRAQGFTNSCVRHLAYLVLGLARSLSPLLSLPSSSFPAAPSPGAKRHTRFPPQNATNLPVKTLAEKVADAAHLHKQFPVSSGNQHRVKELEWVPVEKTEQPAKALRAAKRTPLAGKEGGPSSPPPLLALMPPAPSSTNTFSPLPTVAAPPVFQVEEVPQPVSSAVVTSTVAEPTDAPVGLLTTTALGPSPWRGIVWASIPVVPLASVLMAVWGWKGWHRVSHMVPSLGGGDRVSKPTLVS